VHIGATGGQLPLVHKRDEDFAGKPHPVAASIRDCMGSRDVTMDAWKDDIEEPLDIRQFLCVRRLKFDDE
jgi:hypothetical protein